MCNLHGTITTKASTKTDDFLKDGFIAGGVRGTDSSGLAVVNVASSTCDWHKLPVNGTMFIQDKATAALLHDARAANVISIGHLRAATSGRVDYNNSHPFYMEQEGREFIGVHNGTLQGWSSHKDAKFYSVDSEWALNLIFSEGEEAFKSFRGAYCFIWWDSEDKEVLNIALNDQRTMFAAFLEDGTMAYASEAGMLYWLCERNGMKLDGPIIQLDSNQWYKFNVKDPADFTKSKLPEAAAVYTAPPRQYGYTQESVFDKVQAVLAKAADMFKPSNSPLLPPTDKPANPAVTKEEVEAAKKMGIQNAKGTFLPDWVDEKTGSITGTFAWGDMELSGVIRNAALVSVGPNASWHSTCIGIIEVGDDITVVCSKPRIKLPADNKVVVH